MSEPIIQVENIFKIFKLYDHPKDRLKEALSPFRKKYHHEYLALKNISFELMKGDSLGILGKNGAGKSTLLKVITGVLTPTSGSYHIKGRIAALLELGAGFNPELSGLENIYFQGAIIGYSKEEMDSKIPLIVEFADIGEFINQPVKTYSSGMFARLAFSISINVDPDVLIVDEALSVGDIGFQAKCMIRMRKMMESGTTLIFVSHDANMVKGLCNKCLTISEGKLVDFGESAEVVDRYIGTSHEEINQILNTSAKKSKKEDSPSQRVRSKALNEEVKVSLEEEINWPSTVNRYGDGGARILDIKLLNPRRNVIDKLEVDETFIIQISVRFNQAYEKCVLGYSFRDLKGQQLIGALSPVTENVQTGDVLVFDVTGENKLREGIYTISVGIEVPIILHKQHMFLDVIEHAVVFKSDYNDDPEAWFPSIVKVPSVFKTHKYS